jgi:hypothetical protein
MKEEDVILLEQQDNGTLAKWWCELNKWNWPEQIPDKEDPEDRKNNRRLEIMDWIKSRIGLKECLREWNRETLHGRYFDEWWAKYYE